MRSLPIAGGRSQEEPFRMSRDRVGVGGDPPAEAHGVSTRQFVEATAAAFNDLAPHSRVCRGARRARKLTFHSRHSKDIGIELSDALEQDRARLPLPAKSCDADRRGACARSSSAVACRSASPAALSAA